MKKLFLVAIAVVAVGLVAREASAAKKSTPGWSQIVEAAKRFKVLEDFGGQAVLDAETGLVWEQAPSSIAVTWSTAQFHCNTLSLGGRRGWRLPALQELASLTDPTNVVNPVALPVGHPFLDVEQTQYWSSTTSAEGTTDAWYVDFFDRGDVGEVDKSTLFRGWCVRGGAGGDSQ